MTFNINVFYSLKSLEISLKNETIAFLKSENDLSLGMDGRKIASSDF